MNGNFSELYDTKWDGVDSDEDGAADGISWSKGNVGIGAESGSDRLTVDGDIKVTGSIKKDCKEGYTRCHRYCARMVSEPKRLWEHVYAAREEGAFTADYKEAVEVSVACDGSADFALPDPGIWLSEVCGSYESNPRTMALFIPGPSLDKAWCKGDAFDCSGMDCTLCERINQNPNAYLQNGTSYTGIDGKTYTGNYGGALYVYPAEY